jgi:hypothetical protein
MNPKEARRLVGHRSNRSNDMNHIGKKARDRVYHVQAHALLEERRVTGMSDEQFDKRHREIMASCYGDDEKK